MELNINKKITIKIKWTKLRRICHVFQRKQIQTPARTRSWAWYKVSSSPTTTNLKH